MAHPAIDAHLAHAGSAEGALCARQLDPHLRANALLDRGPAHRHLVRDESRGIAEPQPRRGVK